jgi:large repetitive protein
VNYTFNATDPDDPVVAQSCTPAPGSSFPVGSTTIDCTATDSNGNVGNETFEVVVSDTTAPELTVPGTTTAEATSPAGAAVNFVVSAADAVDGPLTPSCSSTSGSTFPVGSTTVDCTVSDAHENSSSASFAVVVADTTAPTLSVPGAIVVNATSPAGAAVTYLATATDLVDGPVAPSCSTVSGTVFSIGTTAVTCTATDAHGNASAAKSFTVRVKGAADQLADVFQVVQQWNLRGHDLADDVRDVSEALTKRTPQRACKELVDLERDLGGSHGKRLTTEQLAWLRGELARIDNVLGCSGVQR